MADYEEEEDSFESLDGQNKEDSNLNNESYSSNDHVTSRDQSEDRPPPPGSPLSDKSFDDPEDDGDRVNLKRPHPQDSDNEDESLQKRVHLEEEKRNDESAEGEEELEHDENDEEEKEDEEEEEEVKSKGEIDDIPSLQKEEEEREEAGEKEREEKEIEEEEEEEGEGEEEIGEGVMENVTLGEEDDDEISDTELQGILQQDEETVPANRQESGEDSGVEDNKETLVSDFDTMMQRRKEAMSKARKRRKKDIDITSNDDHILAMIRQMKEAAEEDRRLNLQQNAATKKLQLLPTIVSHLKKADLITSMIECGMCSALADWLKPLPDRSLPHLKIREAILDALKTFPSLDGHILKTSGLGKAIMLLYKHPKELKKNREKAGKMINAWARPVFGLTADFKGLSRDEREERDWAHLSQAARRRLSSDSRETDPSRMNESEAQKPGDKGWIGRARVPMPSNKDYVVRPKWNKQHEFTKGSSKKTLNRYEKQVQKKKEKMTRGKNTHAVSISIEGRNMSL